MSTEGAYLVVNGDDGGADTECDDALLTSFHAGLLTSISVLANGGTTEEFARRSGPLGPGLSLGLHLNLSEGASLSGEIKGLTDHRGRFADDKVETWRRLAEDAIDEAALAREIAMQWQRLIDCGVAIDHIDGHNHVQMFPVVIRALGEALPENRPLFLRMSHEEEHPEPLHPNFWRNRISPSDLREFCRRQGWRSADHFVGFGFSATAEISSLPHLFPARDGITEFMVHPGCRTGSAFTESPQRHRELETLLDEKTRERFQSAGYQLVSFAELS